jgi:quercetin dioxygenase-like cupin family protein
MSASPRVDVPTRLAAADALPWAEVGGGFAMKLFRRGHADGVYSMLNRFAPGFRAPKHRHLGEVHGYTLEGRWHYEEYDWEAGPGDYIYEPAGSIHTLVVPADNPGPTVVFFTVALGLELFDDQGNMFMVQDAPGMELLYRVSLEKQGLAYPDSVLP